MYSPTLRLNLLKASVNLSQIIVFKMIKLLEASSPQSDRFNM